MSKKITIRFPGPKFEKKTFQLWLPEPIHDFLTQPDVAETYGTLQIMFEAAITNELNLISEDNTLLQSRLFNYGELLRCIKEDRQYNSPKKGDNV